MRARIMGIMHGMHAARGKRAAFVSVAAGTLVAIAAGWTVIGDLVARQGILSRIHALDASVPRVLIEVGRPVEEIRRDVARCRDLCNAYLLRWPGRREARAVRATLLRMLGPAGLHDEMALRAGGAGPRELDDARDARDRELVEVAGLVMDSPEARPADRALALLTLVDLDPEAVVRRGGIPAMRPVLEGACEEHSASISSRPDGPERRREERLLDEAVAWLARVEVALGRRAEAEARLLAHQRKRGEESGWSVFALLRCIETSDASRPEDRLDHVVWGTEDRIDLREDRGRISILMSHGVTLGSGLDAVQDLDRIVAAHRGEGVVGAVLVPQSGEDASRLVARSVEAREILRAAGISLPVGVLPGEGWKRLLPRTCGGTCAILRPGGELAAHSMLGTPSRTSGPLRQERNFADLVLRDLIAAGGARAGLERAGTRQRRVARDGRRSSALDSRRAHRPHLARRSLPLQLLRQAHASRSLLGRAQSSPR
jgi:hypothetical protein